MANSKANDIPRENRGKIVAWPSIKVSESRRCSLERLAFLTT